MTFTIYIHIHTPETTLYMADPLQTCVLRNFSF